MRSFLLGILCAVLVIAIYGYGFHQGYHAAASHDHDTMTAAQVALTSGH